MRKIQFYALLVTKIISRYFKRISHLKKSVNSTPKSHLSALGEITPKRHKQIKYVYPLVILGLAIFLAWGLKPFISHQSLVSQGVVGVYTLTNLPPTVTNLLSQPLVTLDKTGYPQPNLVNPWQTSEDVQTYTFTLKDNLYWTDGTKVRAQDLVFHLPDVDVSYPNDSTIQFKLADSFAPFPTLLTQPVFKQQTLVGIGKYKLADIRTNGSIITKLVLTRVNPTDYSLPDISIRFYPDEKTALTAFDLGEVDSILGLNETSDFESQPSVKTVGITSFNKITAIFYNVDDPILSDENLRQALTAATPVINGETQANTSLPPYLWAYNDQVKQPINDLDFAKKHLQKVENLDGKMITLTTSPHLAPVGKQIITAWKRAGIDSILRIESGVPQNFQALLISENIPSDPDQYTLWHSTQSKTNLSKVPFAARLDKDLEDGRKIASSSTRKEKYLDFQKVLADHAPATFLYFPKVNVVYRKKTEPDLTKLLPIQIPTNG